jgi:hypothetical protein
MYKFTVLSLVVLSLTGCDTSKPPEQLGMPRAELVRLEADIRFLADDALEGREAGSRGYDLAALFVAERFRALGLEPGGVDGGFFQPVPMLESELGPSASLTIGDLKIAAGEDYLVFPSSQDEIIDISAPLVFAGLCFASERHGRNDFEGLNLDGKIAVCMSGAPKHLNSEEMAHFRSTQAQRLSDQGAIGVISVWSDSLEKIFPFERAVRMLSRDYSSMSWLDTDGVPFSLAPNVKARASLSHVGGEKLMTAAGQSWEEILAATESEAGDVARFNLGLDGRIRVDSKHRILASDNVVGILPGSDPALADEYVVLVAHLDGLGVKATPEEDDDEIYNGAMDNASGISALLEVARLLKVSPPRRSVIFLAVTAEEKGLNGSDFFAQNPTVAANQMVAVVNLDMPIMTYPFTDIIAYGAERSTLYQPVLDAAESHGLVLSPDPVPEEGIFTRSDHYTFVRQGVPAVYLKPGFADGGEEEQTTFRKEHYHEPSDEIELVDFDVLRRFTDVKADIARNIADMQDRPVWNAGDFFGETFKGPMSENQSL